MNELNKTLIGLSGIDLVKLAIPKLPDYNMMHFSENMIAQINLINKHGRQINAAHQIAISGFTPGMTDLARTFEKKSELDKTVFQSITEKLKPILLQQSQIADKFENIGAINQTALEAIKNLCSIDVFDRFRETFMHCEGFFDLESVTEEEIEQTIRENKEIFIEFNTIVLNAKVNEVLPNDVPGLIYMILHDKISIINQKTLSIIVLIFCTLSSFYGLYSDYTTNSAIENEIVPTLNEIYKKIENGEANNDDVSDAINDLKDDIEEFKQENKDKFDLLYQEILKHGLIDE